MKAGKKKIFMCSQVDSFTAEKGATAILSVQPYKKCKIVPITAVKVSPTNDQSASDFLIYSYDMRKPFSICKARGINALSIAGMYLVKSFSTRTCPLHFDKKQKNIRRIQRIFFYILT